MAKRLFDIVASLAALLLLSPLLLGAALAVWLGSGRPVLFQQVRIGRGGREFRMLKFRSMVPNAAALGPYFTEANDPRITPVGRFLRKSSIDELPQLLNVLAGDMSLVGPRPDTPAQRAHYTEAQWQARHAVRPGITGLAQATYRSDCTHEQRLALDLDYARAPGLWRDLGIILRTVRVLGGRHSN